MTQLVPINTAAEPADQASTFRHLFFGTELRAGWRLALFVVLVIAIGFPVSWLTSRFIPSLSGTLAPRDVIPNEIRRFLVVFLASLVMARIERRSISQYGLPTQGMFGKAFWVGSLWGFVMITAIIGMMAATHSYAFGPLAIASIPSAIKFGVLWLLAFLTVGFAEEFSFRGYIQFTLTKGLGFWSATAITCAFFAWVHHGNPGETWVGLFNIVLIAAFVCLSLRRTGSLWFPIGWHMAFDWGESFFYSVPDSGTHVVGHLLDATIQGNKWLTGGTVGPEASIFNVLVTIVGIIVFARLYPRAKYPYPDRAERATSAEALTPIH